MNKVICGLIAASLTAATAGSDDAPSKKQLGDAALAAFVSGETAALQTLYEERFGASGAGTGNFDVLIIVDKSGAVDQVVFEQDTVADEEFAEDLREHIRAWRLPPETWGGNWELQLEFDPAEGTYGVSGP